jgi:phosphocarrier protein
MISKKVTIVNAMGFHMRPAMSFANAMTKYPCDVTICSNGVKTDGKSIMNIIASCIKCGMEIEVICNGEREDEALNEAVTMIESGFGE